LRGAPGDLGVDGIAVRHLRRDQLASQFRGVLITFLVGQMPLEDRIGRPLPELGLEHRG
jgi:hypothetical protein